MRSLVALSVLGVALSTSAVHAATATFQRQQVVVAATGRDHVYCGLPTTPCRTFQKALEVVLPGGIITTAGPGNYGAMKITKSVAIMNDGAGIATVEGEGGRPAIEIAKGYSVVLRGLTVDGRGTASAGILYAGGGGYLLVSKSFIQGALTGIRIAPQFGGTVTIEDSVVTDNVDGVVSSSSPKSNLSVVLIHVTISNNGSLESGVGLKVGGAGAAQHVAMTDTTINDNGYGVTVNGSEPKAVVVTATNSAIVNNGWSAVVGSGGTLTLDRTMVRSRSANYISNAGSIISFGDNAIVDPVTGNPITPVALK